MKTKLEVGKEYWLSAQKISRGIYLGESNSGNFDFRITLGSKYTKPLGELDVMTSNLSVYSEYIPEKPYQFITPIAMKCTEEQFNGIKDKLVEMGYKVNWFNWGGVRYLTNNYNSVMGNVDSTGVVYGRGRIIFESFNPDLFLALAAMTDNEYGIKGEWWIGTSSGKLFKQTIEKSLNTSGVIRKATAQEIIEHFEKEEFVLPERWCVKAGDLNTNESILKWRRENTKYKYYSGSIGYIDCDGYFTEKPLYQEITSDQFKKYVLKGTPPSCQNEVEFTGIPVPMFDPITGNIYPNYSCCQKTPSISSIEYTVNVEFDAEKAAEEIFAKIVEWSKPTHTANINSYQRSYLHRLSKSWEWRINDKDEVEIKEVDIIQIPPTKQATLFDDRVEITDWKPKDNDEVLVVSINVDGWGFTKTKYKFVAEPYKANGFIKRTESEAKQLVEKLKQAML